MPKPKCAYCSKDVKPTQKCDECGQLICGLCDILESDLSYQVCHVPKGK